MQRDDIDTAPRLTGKVRPPELPTTGAGKAFLLGEDEMKTGDRGLPPLPGEVPGIRRHLLGQWDEDKGFWRLADMIAPGNTPAQLYRFIDSQRDVLGGASLWWVSEAMTDVLVAAARSVPDDVLAEELLPLATRGLVVFERALSAKPSRIIEGVADIAVDAFAWGPTRIPPREGRTEAEAAVGISAYQYSPRTVQDESQQPTIDKYGLDHDGRIWMCLGRSDWPLGDALGSAPYPGTDDDQLDSYKEDRRLLCALTTLLAHGGIATQRQATVPRGERRRLERQGVKPETLQYRIVNLRTEHEPGERHADAEGATGESRYGHRWIVEGHMRLQPYGPGRSLRRLQWINPYVKGPADAPLVVRDVVHAWRK